METVWVKDGLLLKEAVKVRVGDAGDGVRVWLGVPVGVPVGVGENRGVGEQLPVGFVGENTGVKEQVRDRERVEGVGVGAGPVSVREKEVPLTEREKDRVQVWVRDGVADPEPEGVPVMTALGERLPVQDGEALSGWEKEVEGEEHEAEKDGGDGVGVAV